METPSRIELGVNPSAEPCELHAHYRVLVACHGGASLRFREPRFTPRAWSSATAGIRGVLWGPVRLSLRGGRDALCSAAADVSPGPRSTHEEAFGEKSERERWLVAKGSHLEEQTRRARRYRVSANRPRIFMRCLKEKFQKLVKRREYSRMCKMRKVKCLLFSDYRVFVSAMKINFSTRILERSEILFIST